MFCQFWAFQNAAIRENSLLVGISAAVTSLAPLPQFSHRHKAKTRPRRGNSQKCVELKRKLQAHVTPFNRLLNWEFLLKGHIIKRIFFYDQYISCSTG